MVNKDSTFIIELPIYDEIEAGYISGMKLAGMSIKDVILQLARDNSLDQLLKHASIELKTPSGYRDGFWRW